MTKEARISKPETARQGVLAFHLSFGFGYSFDIRHSDLVIIQGIPLTFVIRISSLPRVFLGHSSFGFGHYPGYSFVIRHSDFVIIQGIPLTFVIRISSLPRGPSFAGGRPLFSGGTAVVDKPPAGRLAAEPQRGTTR